MLRRSALLVSLALLLGPAAGVLPDGAFGRLWAQPKTPPPPCEHQWGEPTTGVSVVERCKITSTCRTCVRCKTTRCTHAYEGDCDRFKKREADGAKGS